MRLRRGLGPGGVARAELLRLGMAGAPWAFLPTAAAALGVEPEDAELRGIAARQLGRLGLRALATEQLAQAVRDGLPVAEAARIESALAALPDRQELFATDGRLAHARANAEALASIGDRLSAPAGWDARSACEAWAAGAPREVFAAADGNIVSRAPGDLDLSRWTLADARSAARAAAAPATTAQAQSPIVVAGVCPPWFLAEAARAGERAAWSLPGFRRAVRIIEEDPAALFEGLSLGDLRTLIADERTRWFVGPGAGERFAAELSRPSGVVRAGLVVGPERVPWADAVRAAVRRVSAEDASELPRLRAAVHARAGERDAAWWHRRYAAALAPGTVDPLRVLVPSCRYTTYVQHSARALARAFERLGCRSEMLIEPDDHSVLSPNAYWATIDRFDPDLIVSINYPRCTRREAFPEAVPFVCWVQDNMPQVFDPDAGRAQTGMDFLVSNNAARLVRRFGYPARRSLHAPVCTDDATFHDGPVDPSLRDRFACDVAYVSHHGESPAQLHERLAASAGDARGERMLHAVRERVEALLHRGEAEHRKLGVALRAIVTEELSAAGLRSDHAAAERLVEQHAMPLAERIVRHESVGWAAEICARRGWRLRLYGNGWDAQPAFARFAAGAVTHGEELRACYQAAGVHLHASAINLVHQRVMECALSGGLPLLRITPGVLAQGPAIARLAGLAEPEAERIEADEAVFAVADSPILLFLTSLRQRLGLPADAEVRVPRAVLAMHAAEPILPGVEDGAAERAFGDLAEIGFASKDALEAAIEQAVHSPDRRAGASAMVRSVVRDRFTLDGLAARMLRMVADGLTARPPA